MTDQTVAQVARRLTQALSTYARERRPEYAKEIAQLQTELCAAVRAEANEQGIVSTES